MSTYNSNSESDEAEPLLGRLGSVEPVAKPTVRSVYYFTRRWWPSVKAEAMISGTIRIESWVERR